MAASALPGGPEHSSRSTSLHHPDVDRRSAGGVGLGDQPQAPWNGVVAAIRAWSIAMVEVLDVAGADGEGLIVPGADHLAAAEVLGPRRALNVTLLAVMNGLLWLAASGVQEPLIALEVYGRLPISQTILLCCLLRNSVNSGLEFGRCQIPERPLYPLPVVKDLDKPEGVDGLLAQITSRLVPVSVAAVSSRSTCAPHSAWPATPAAITKRAPGVHCLLGTLPFFLTPCRLPHTLPRVPSRRRSGPPG